MAGRPKVWTDEKLGDAKYLMEHNFSARKVGKIFGATKNAILGALYRDKVKNGYVPPLESKYARIRKYNNLITYAQTVISSDEIDYYSRDIEKNDEIDLKVLRDHLVGKVGCDKKKVYKIYFTHYGREYDRKKKKELVEIRKKYIDS